MMRQQQRAGFWSFPSTLHAASRFAAESEPEPVGKLIGLFNEDKGQNWKALLDLVSFQNKHILLCFQSYMFQVLNAGRRLGSHLAILLF